MNQTTKHEKWKEFWAKLGIRHLGMSPEDFIPSPKDRCEYGFKNGITQGYQLGESAGRLQAYEVAVGILYHQYLIARTFQGKESETALLLKNCIHSVRDAQAADMEIEKAQEPTQDE